ncbi:hypothetical protein DGG96_12335 [Legionella qingyii]|uniref:Uncharacterized protein n=1 Tax=Legionella qingyii TaxID=2184757 RepID=A0A317U221_9GAMM|nr:hypothetical protein DGG96_12335 [Legionella qingyii]
MPPKKFFNLQNLFILRLINPMKNSNQAYEIFTQDHSKMKNGFIGCTQLGKIKFMLIFKDDRIFSFC